VVDTVEVGAMEVGAAEVEEGTGVEAVVVVVAAADMEVADIAVEGANKDPEEEAGTEPELVRDNTSCIVCPFLPGYSE